MNTLFITLFVLISCFSPVIPSPTSEIVWMIDDSYSIARGNYRNAKRMITSVNEMIINDERYTNTTAFGLLEFGTRITGAEPITSDYEKFDKQLKKNRYGSTGQTRMSNAFDYVNRKMFNENKTVDNRILAIVTDGAPIPGTKYGGSNLVRAVNETFEAHGLDRLVYIMVSNSIGRRKANENQFVKVHGYYNKSEDFISINFKNQVSDENKFEVFCKLVENCYNETTMPPSLSPTAMPSMVPTPKPTIKPTMFTLPPGFTWAPHTHEPHAHEPHTHEPHEHDDGLSAGVIAGIVLGVLALVVAIAALAYTKGNENN